MADTTKWSSIGHIYLSNRNGIDRVKIIFNNNEYEMQLCYLEPILQKFSLRINNEMNPDFDYLSRFEEIERVMKLNCNSLFEQKLKEENEKLREQIVMLKGGIEIMRKALNDVQMRSPIIFDGV